MDTYTYIVTLVAGIALGIAGTALFDTYYADNWPKFCAIDGHAPTSVEGPNGFRPAVEIQCADGTSIVLHE